MKTETRYRVVGNDGWPVDYVRPLTTRGDARRLRDYMNRNDPGGAPHRIQKAVIEWKDIR